MKIAIDARVASDKMHGINRYVRDLISALAEIDHKNEYILISNCDQLKKFAATKNNFRFLKCNIKLYSIIEQFMIPRILKKEHIDVYHSPTFSAPIFSPCKIVMTIHDMIHLIYADQYSILKFLYYKLIVKTAVHRSAGIITVSENSKKDIIRFLNLPENKVRTIYNGVGESFISQNKEQAKEAIKNKYQVSGDFVLFVGNEKPHKNASNVIKAFDLFIKKNNSKYSLVMVGVSRKYIKKVSNCHLSNQLIIVDNICNDTELIFLYQASSLLLCPSFYEGFGLPLLESMACGTPVITSDNSSISEVVGDAAFMVDPYNKDQISEAIIKVLSDRKLRETLIKNGKKRYKLFSWHQTAQKTLMVYKDVFVTEPY
tara:strand:- start:931 stop:2046 length:1116 start_codon:yes stop_codon:yes gene_type:complete